MARTTLGLDPAILHELRRRGARDAKSMGRVASELLAGALAEPEPESPSLDWCPQTSARH